MERRKVDPVVICFDNLSLDDIGFAALVDSTALKISQSNGF